jgi:hypothetical protein
VDSGRRTASALVSGRWRATAVEDCVDVQKRGQSKKKMQREVNYPTTAATYNS